MNHYCSNPIVEVCVKSITVQVVGHRMSSFAHLSMKWAFFHGPLENIPDVAAVHLADASSSSSSSPSSSSASNFKPLYCTHTTPNTHRCFQWSALLRDGTGQSRDKRPVLTAYLPQDGTPREESPARPRCLPRKVFFFGWKMFFKHSAYLSHFTE